MPVDGAATAASADAKAVAPADVSLPRVRHRRRDPLSHDWYATPARDAVILNTSMVVEKQYVARTRPGARTARAPQHM